MKSPDNHFLASEFPNTSAAEALFHIIPVPLEESVSYIGGTAHGPAAIIEASQQLEVWDGFGIPGQAGISTAPAVDCKGTRESIYAGIHQAVSQSLSYQGPMGRPIPIILGGEHSLTLPVIEAFAESYGRESIGIIQFDAHADLRDQLDDNPYSHACVMRRIVESLGVRLLQLGTRAVSPEEMVFRREHSILHFDARELATENRTSLPLPADFPPHVYISFDLDGLDASIMPATGTPVPGGLSWYQALSLLESIGRQRKIIGCDIVELAPLAGFVAPTFLAAELVHRMMGVAMRSASGGQA
jgi:agmatinase